MHTPSPPSPPDPAAQAAAQTGTNIATSEANAAVNNVNQVTPYGNLTYNESGHRFISDPNGQTYWTNGQGQYQTSQPMTAGTPGTPGHWTTTAPDPNGNSYGNKGGYTWVPGTGGGQVAAPGWSQVKGEYVPTYTATQTLSPQEQAIFDQTSAANLNMGTIANEQSAKLRDYLNTPIDLPGNVDLSAANTNKYINDHWTGEFNNQWDRQQEQQQQQLADQGIQSGTDAYRNSMHDFSTNRQSAMDQYMGDMYNNADNAIVQQHNSDMTDAITKRQEPLNEINSLLGNAQMTPPTYASFSPSSQMPTVDVAGLQQQKFSNQMGVYQQQLANSNAAMGGLFGLGSAALGGWAMHGFSSDRRLKNDIERVGTLPSGLPVYDFNYVWDSENRYRGVMSDEVREVFPHAVMAGPGGFDMVDYARIG